MYKQIYIEIHSYRLQHTPPSGLTSCTTLQGRREGGGGPGAIWVKYFRAKGGWQRARYLFFWGKVPRFGRKNGGKVAGKQLQRPRPENFFP